MGQVTRRGRRAASTAVKVVAAAADRVVPPPRGFVVLIYHRVGGASGSNVDVSARVFEQQVGELADAQRIISLDDALAGRAGPSDVVLTFDDGTADWVDEALPVLVRHRAPATFYVATDFVDQQRRLPGGARPITWAGLGELTASGLATIGSHTHTHALLDRADGPAAAAEVDRSIELIGERLAISCRHFAYPKALLGSPEAEAVVRSRFASAAVGGSRANVVGRTDVHRIARTPIQVSDGLRWFRRKNRGGMRLEEAGRSLLNRRRYASVTT